MSRAERFALAGALVLLLLQAAVALAPALGSALEYRYIALAAQPWRGLSGHVVHINWPHVLVNAAAWIIVARLFAQELDPARQLVVLLTTGVVISVGLAILCPQIAWYRGFSGVLHGLFFAGATTWSLRMLVQVRTRSASAAWLPAALVVGGWIKVALEQPAAGAMPYAEWLGAATVPQAHLLGAACGTAFGLLFALARGSVAAPAARDQRE
ncbi:MAG TPA: rhombosortase [Burkholderiaceae bacterium]|nr:rhombosortase [Burkholderiaceae bacterium]